MTDSKADSQATPEAFTFDAKPDAEFRGWRTFERLVREFVSPHWRLWTIAFVSMAIVAATAGALPFLLQRMGDDVFVAKDKTLVFVVPLIMIGLIGVRAIANWGAIVAEGSLGTKVVAELRSRMFDTVAAADLAWIQGFHSGRFVSAFVYDVMLIERSAAQMMSGLVKNGLSVIFLLGAMLYMDWKLGLIVLVGMPFAILNLGKQKRRMRRATGRTLQEFGDFDSMLTQTLQGMRVVKAYGQEANEAQRFNRIVRNIRKYIMKGTRSRAAVGPLWEFINGLGFALAIFYGGWQGIQGGLSLGQFMGFMTAALLVFQPLRSLATIQATLSEGLLATQRVFELIDYVSHVKEAPRAKPLRVEGGAVSFRQVNFAYGDAPVLSDFNLEIPAGAKVALVGPSGAGKTTVLNLILRFFDPVGGSISIDGQDLRGVTISSVRSASALLTQDPVLFDDTIAANIAYGSEWASEDDIIVAAHATAAHDFIMRLPGGYQARVGEAGNRLSGGERQRIAFARAMLRNTPILLLDEPTSALDAESEVKVQAAMDRLLKGRTVVLIAHRLATVKKVDMICCMENGRIVEAGTHQELVARRGKYANMVQAQLLGDETQLATAGS